MDDKNLIERKANAAARGLMGDVGWLTIWLGLVCTTVYIGTLYLVLSQQINLVAAYALISLLTYAIYTVMHDAVHGSIQGKKKSYSWVNAGLGYLAGQILFLSFQIHKNEHLAHHRHTNEPDLDPDNYVENDTLMSLLIGASKTNYVQYKYYFTRAWKNASTVERSIVFIELITMLAWRMAIVAAGFWWESLVIFVFATFTGTFILIVLFAWLPHRPNTETERYKNTNTFLMPERVNSLVTWLWLFQNYHSIHHLFPRVPFYNYKKLFEQIEPAMIANNAPIVRVGG